MAGWSISTRDLKRVNSLEEASDVWNRAVPWTNTDPSWRQLGGRRAHHKRIEKLDDRGYACVLYSHALVSYYTDGSVALSTHDSASSLNFAHYVAPVGCAPISHYGRMYWRVDTMSGRQYFRSWEAPLRIRPTAKGMWGTFGDIPEAPTEVIHDRKLGAMARKLIKPYTDWLAMTERLTGHPAVPNYVTLGKHHVAQLMAKNGDVAFFPQLAASGGTALSVRKHAYDLTGANIVTPTPYDRLPRRA